MSAVQIRNTPPAIEFRKVSYEVPEPDNESLVSILASCFAKCRSGLIATPQASAEGTHVNSNDVETATSEGPALYRSSSARNFKKVLTDVSGSVDKGELLAVLGPSGSGKTSLLNLLAARSQYSHSAGTILFNGQPRTPRTKRDIAYVMQDDVFFPGLTVQETLDFVASIRLRDVTDKDGREAAIESVSARIGLTKCRNTRIGDQQFHKGISGGERKRLNIASELLHDPSMLLLDEPTSGLDASTALIVVRLLRDLVNEGKTVITTMHQPSSSMFEMFDKILLLTEGRVAYCGPARDVKAYFESIHFRFPVQGNPCDFMTEMLVDDFACLPSALRRGEQSQNNVRQTLINEWNLKMQEDENHEMQNGARQNIGTDANSESRAKLLPCSFSNSFWSGFIRAIVKRYREIVGLPDRLGLPQKYPTCWTSQVHILSTRALRQKRYKILKRSALAQLFVLILTTALVYYRHGSSEVELSDRIGAHFFFASIWTFSSTLSSLHAFPAERAVLDKDRANGMYRLSAYYIAKTIVEIPADVLHPLIFSCLVYWIDGFNAKVSRFFTFTSVLVLIVLCANSLGLFISAAVMDIEYAEVIAVGMMIITMMFGGIYVNWENLPAFLKPFLQLSFMRHGYEALVRNEISGEEYSCASDPTAYTIYSQCGSVCPIPRDVLLKQARVTSGISIGVNVGAMIGWIVVCRILGYFALKYIHKRKPSRLSS